MKKKIIIWVVLAAILIVGGGVSLYYYNEVSKYVSTEDARLAVDMRAIGPGASGKLVEWRYKEGDSFNKGDVLGIVETSPAHGNTPATTQEIVAPEKGTILNSNIVKDMAVGATTTLAYSGDLDQLYVTANLEETSINDIHVGSKVSIKIDAFPGTTFTGRVEKIGLGTNASFSLMPTSNSSGNFTKVVQRVPVKISLDSYQGKRLIPGLNCVIKIEKH